ncbi:hypothetical protein [Cellulomonas sp.]|uniref:hypothetical protein n=1 Tax=Cellulomonas sp. TaxID=40001 RepID=UPI00258A7449|nr:hypothetical protein [Cellulomonas sp.]MCR6688213.1 hypothetical protein [Cellulomonas sp.]
MSTTTVDTDRQDERKRKRAAIIKFSLAGAALLGIGAAATSAAWTDQAWFSASASGATFELQGKNFASPATFVDADDASAKIVIPSAELAQLVPGATRTLTLTIKNSGSVEQAVTEAHTWLAGAGTFVAAPTVAVAGVPAGTLAAGAEATVTVTVTTPSDWAVGNQGKSQDLQLVFTGTSV